MSEAPRSLKERLLFGGAWIVAGKLVTAFSTLLVSALLTRLMPLDVVGVYGLTFSFVSLAAMASQLGLHQAVVRLVAESMSSGDTARARKAISIAFRYTLLGVILVSGVLLAGLGDKLALGLWNSPLMAATMGAIVKNSHSMAYRL